MRVTEFVRFFALAALATASTRSAASAAIIVSDNFDGYANQAAFDAVWTPDYGHGQRSPHALSVSGPNSVGYATTAIAMHR